MQKGIKYSPYTQDQLTDYVVLPWFTDKFIKNNNELGPLFTVAEQLKADGVTLKGHALIHKRGAPGSLTVDEIPEYLSGKVAGWEGLIDEWDILCEVQGFMEAQPDWMAVACRFMRDMFPDSTLWYSEYGVQNKQYWEKVRGDAISLHSRGLIDGVGIQAHTELSGYWARVPGTSQINVKDRTPLPAIARTFGSKIHTKLTKKRLKTEADALMAAGLKVQLSEVSVVGFKDQQELCAQTEEEYFSYAQELGLDTAINWGKRLWYFQ